MPNSRLAVAKMAAPNSSILALQFKVSSVSNGRLMSWRTVLPKRPNADCQESSGFTLKTAAAHLIYLDVKYFWQPLERLVFSAFAFLCLSPILAIRADRNRVLFTSLMNNCVNHLAKYNENDNVLILNFFKPQEINLVEAIRSQTLQTLKKLRKSWLDNVNTFVSWHFVGK